MKTVGMCSSLAPSYSQEKDDENERQSHMFASELVSLQFERDLAKTVAIDVVTKEYPEKHFFGCEQIFQKFCNFRKARYYV